MDINVLAFRIVERATSDEPTETTVLRKKKAAAGVMGGRARAAKLSATERKRIALKANRARWKKSARRKKI
jgi:hypothetical protein